MFKTIETNIAKQAALPALQAEFAQHDFNELRPFCRLTYIASIFIWLLLNLLISFKGNLGFTGLSMLLLGAMVSLTVIQGFIGTYRHFDVLNVIFVVVMTLGIRLIVVSQSDEVQPIWLVLATASIFYSASVLPLSRWAFLAVVLVTWVTLNPFLMTSMEVMDLRGSLILCFYIFLCSLSIYCFFKLRRVKLYNFALSKLLMHQAYMDALTNIPNRRSFMSEATHVLLAQPREHDHYLAMIDIDNFKKINDRYGHDVGDEVLIRTAASIKSVMTGHVYARLGGEEFSVYLSGLRRNDVEALMDTLCRNVHEDPHEHPVTISIGLARIDDDDTLNQALLKADKALYTSKHTGKNRFTFYS